MSGSGGFKQRNKRLLRKRSRSRKLGAENLRRVKKLFEGKGQTWDPTNNSVQATALNHHGRRTAKVSKVAAKARPAASRAGK